MNGVAPNVSAPNGEQHLHHVKLNYLSRSPKG